MHSIAQIFDSCKRVKRKDLMQLEEKRIVIQTEYVFIKKNISTSRTNKRRNPSGPILINSS